MRREQNITNQPTVSRVVLAVPAQKKWSKPLQTHKEILTRYQVGKPLSMFFNDVLHNNEETYDIYGFMQPNYWFNHNYSVERIVKKFQELPHVGAIYTDFFDEKPNYLDPFSHKLQPLNTSIFINGRYRHMLQFATEDVFSGMMLQMMQRGLLIIHIAEQLLRKYE